MLNTGSSGAIPAAGTSTSTGPSSKAADEDLALGRRIRVAVERDAGRNKPRVFAADVGMTARQLTLPRWSLSAEVDVEAPVNWRGQKLSLSLPRCRDALRTSAPSSCERHIGSPYILPWVVFDLRH
jgi:hypothetical protein